MFLKFVCSCACDRDRDRDVRRHLVHLLYAQHGLTLCIQSSVSLTFLYVELLILPRKLAP